MRDASEKRYRYIRRTADTRIEMEIEMESDVETRAWRRSVVTDPPILGGHWTLARPEFAGK